jgi:hypothetical protein
MADADLIHPRDALFDPDERAVPSLPVCDHYSGVELRMRKSLELQAEMGPVFDVTLDNEDGAPVGGEVEHAHLIASPAGRRRSTASGGSACGYCRSTMRASTRYFRSCSSAAQAAGLPDGAQAARPVRKCSAPPAAVDCRRRRRGAAPYPDRNAWRAAGGGRPSQRIRASSRCRSA